MLLDPYGGPHFASVMQFQGAFRELQWFANQGFAVVVVDGRGTPGAPAWERAVHGDFAARYSRTRCRAFTPLPMPSPNLT